MFPWIEKIKSETRIPEGEYEITCSSESDAVSAYVQVVGEVLNPMVQATSLAFSEAEMALSDVAISNGAADEELIMAYLRLVINKKDEDDE